MMIHRSTVIKSNSGELSTQCDLVGGWPNEFENESGILYIMVLAGR